ncbi:hypothetical protein COK16_27880 [Bacillus cereus]|nr:hypothetical protein COK16_27880 [Bacillus cereus]
MGRYLDTQPKKNGGPRKKIRVGLTPEIVRDLNQQGISDKEISIMYDRSFTYVGKWESEGKWQGPTDMREIKKS